MSIDIAGECPNMCEFDSECGVFFKEILRTSLLKMVSKKGNL